jgi:hypothetical protein
MSMRASPSLAADDISWRGSEAGVYLIYLLDTPYEGSIITTNKARLAFGWSRFCCFWAAGRDVGPADQFDGVDAPS